LWLDRCDFVISAQDRFLFQASIGFDIALTMIFWAPYVLTVPQGAEKEFKVMSGLIRTHQVSLMYFTPSHFQAFAPSHGSLAGVTLMLAGEALAHSTAILAVEYGARVWNLYGPTETNALTWKNVAYEQPSLSRHQVPIGKPYLNCRLVLNGSILFLAGTQVGQRYMNLERQTRKRFLYDLHHNDGRSRMYNSGDQSRILETGDFVYLGRVDGQVKISGQRVELGAVESALMDCSAGVRQCAVLVSGKSLVAFVVGPPGLDGQRLRIELASRVARQEIPHRIEVLQKIPLTTTGKVDRKGLEALLEGTERKAAVPNTTMASSMTGMVRSAFLEALEVSSIDESQSFWAQGGTSLAAVALASRLGISLQSIMRDGTVQGLVDQLEMLGSSSFEEEGIQLDVGHGFVNVRQFGSGRAVAVVIASYGWLAATALPLVEGLGKKYRVLVLEFAGLDKGPAEIARVLFESPVMVKVRHLIQLVVGYSGGGVLAFEMAKCLNNSKVLLALLDCSTPPFPFDFDRVFHACVMPFAKMQGVEAGLEHVPKALLPAIFAGLLPRFIDGPVEGIVAAHMGDGMVKMLKRYNEWSPKERLLLNDWLWIGAAESQLSWKAWQGLLAHPPLVDVITEADHGHMLPEAASIILQHTWK
jgi:hypothetical protein